MKKEKTAIIVHRWDGKPKDDWYPSLKKELQSKGYRVLVPQMPNTSEPSMHAWIAKLNEIIPSPSEEMIVIGHSIGCQTILRWMSMLSSKKKVGKVVLIAPWTKLKFVEKEAVEIARPWIETPIAWEMARAHATAFTCVFSDDDPYVAVGQANIFRKKLGAVTLIEKKKGHFTTAKDAHLIFSFV